MKKNLLFTFSAVLIFVSSFGQGSLWNKTTEERVKNLSKMDRSSMPREYQLFSLDFNALKAQLQQAPSENARTSNVIVDFPNQNGEFASYKIFDAPVMEAGLANKYPNIKSYSGVSVDGTSSIRFSITDFGLHVMSFSGKSGTFYIDTYTKDLNNYIVYSKRNIEKTRDFGCLVSDDGHSPIDAAVLSNRVNDGMFRQYRLAIACTIEYSAFHLTAAGTPASATLAVKKGVVLSAMVVSMTRLNGVYEREMSLRMNLVANNDLIIFIDSDSFTNSPQMINEIQPIVDAAIGSANYDMGHGFCTTDSGIAQLASVCGSGKARGITGQLSPVGDPFDIDYTAHEMGHQWGASHTQNNNCNRSADSSFEPGSGSTIMGYAGICAPDVQTNSNDYFHARSILQMTTFVVGSTSCGIATSNGNIAPVVEAGPNYTIPRGTAFILKGTSTDANGDALTYCWEQYNNQVSTQPPTQTATTGPNFRSVSPSTSPNRYMPRFADVLNGNLAPTWEVVPNVARTMNFALTVRDNRSGGGMTNRDDMTVTTASVGPFTITSPSVPDVSWPIGSSQTITWDVAGTTANGINTANVNILISNDGGVTFTTLVANTPNDGTQDIVVPGPASTTGRILIEAVGNIFYAVSKNIAIGYAVVNSCNTYNGTSLPIVTAAGIPANQIGTVNVPITGSISSVSVFNNITHTYLSDVVTDISSPQNPNTFVKVFNRFCGNSNASLNMKFFDGAGTLDCGAGGTTLQNVAPGESFAPFVGQNPQGNWTLRVYDIYTGDNGTLNSWGIEVCTQTVTLLTESFGFDNFSLYPNPNDGTFTVKFNSNTGNDINVAVYDMRGRSIFNNVYQNNGVFEQTLQLDNVQSGIYLVNIQDGDKKIVKKIVVE